MTSSPEVNVSTLSDRIIQSLTDNLTVVSSQRTAPEEISDNLPDLNDSTVGEAVIRRSEAELISFGVLIALVIAITVFGNLLVIVTILTTKKIQTPTNYFILSLSITDLCIGTLVMPNSAIITLHWEWPLGAIFCNIYTSVDVMLCTVSILTLFAISLDRYIAVTRPLRYQQQVTCRRVYKVCGFIWIFSFILAFVPIHLGWNSADGSVQNMANPRICAFELNKVYVLIDSVGTYFAPLTVMCVVYMNVLLITKRQVQEINKLSRLGQTTNMLSNRKKDKKHKISNGDNTHLQIPAKSSGFHSPPKLASDTKATITLASLVLAFAICWIPYFVIFTMKPFISEPVNVHIDLFCLWLGYVNSAINPFLYAYYNSAFRNAFARVLCRGCLATYIYDAKRKQRQRLASTFTDSSELSALNARLNGKLMRQTTPETMPFTVNS